jgi:hypothetical protein
MALLFYMIGEFGRARQPIAAWARPVWLLGCTCYVIHVVSAFGLHHNWSHTEALAYTASRTKSMFAVETGAGLWVNYMFSAVWIMEAAWSRRWNLTSTINQSRWTLIVRMFFLFMIINGAIVFVDGPRRWLGIAGVTTLILIWGLSTRTTKCN